MNQISGCLTEQGIGYPGYEVNDGSSNVQTDVESCRASCRSIGVDYFVYKTNNDYCWCKSSNAGRTPKQDTVSGETSCSGEIEFLQETFIKPLCSLALSVLQLH